MAEPARTKPRVRFRRTRIVLAALLVIAAVAWALHRYAGLSLRVDGRGFVPQLVFYDAESHYDEIERHRARQAVAHEESAETGAIDLGSEPAAGNRERPDTAEQGGRESLATVPRGEDAAAPAERPTADLTTEPGDTSPVLVEPDRGWSQFRGRSVDGVYHGEIRTDWQAEEPARLWREPLGGGHGSFAVGGGVAYTLEQRRDEELLVAYELETGVEIWAQAWPAKFEEIASGAGPRTTPALAGGTVVALGATGELRVFEAQRGAPLWQTNILADAGAPNITWGVSASPLIADGMIVTIPGGRGAGVVAYDLESGAIRWRALDDPAAYTTPMVVELAGIRQLLVVTGTRAVGLGLDGTGPLWEFPWVTDNGVNAAQPVVVDGTHFIISAGYGHGAALVEVGRDGDALRAREVWQNLNLKNKFASSVLYDGYVYGLDEGILVCLDPKTGERRWKRGRYGHGQVLLAGRHLVISTEKGQVALVEATPEEHRELARIDAIRGRTWNNPALGDGILLVRNDREATAFDLRPRRVAGPSSRGWPAGRPRP